jgi:hypothetical protein
MWISCIFALSNAEMYPTGVPASDYRARMGEFGCAQMLLRNAHYLETCGVEHPRENLEALKAEVQYAHPCCVSEQRMASRIELAGWLVACLVAWLFGWPVVAFVGVFVRRLIDSFLFSSWF